MTLADRSWADTGAGATQAPANRGQQSWQPRGWQERGGEGANVGSAERTVSVVAGSILGFLGIGRADVTGLVIAGVGGALIYRGATGRCPMYRAAGIDTAQEDGASGLMGRSSRSRRAGAHLVQSYLIQRSAEELYREWRDFEQFPRIMSHVESVRGIDERRTHWVARGPSVARIKVEWDAEMTADEPGRRIAWRSLPGADVDNSGSVTFTPALGDRGTMVRVVIDFEPPGGRLGRWAANYFGPTLERQIKEDLRNFKRVMEVGELPTVDGQPRGTCTGRGTTE